MSDETRTQFENLVLVACHAVYKADDFARPEDDASWQLEAFQKGEPPFYVGHARRGVELAAEDGAALLVFSGGQTRREAGPRSEAGGYFRLAEHFGWWGTSVAPRAATEEFARDSFENLLFGLCRFYERAGRAPRRVTVVSWAFKQERFGLHRVALRFPESRFRFVGAGDPVDVNAAREAERRNALEPFRRDPYGARPPLSEKREARDPFKRRPPYAATCPPLAPLLGHRGPRLFDGELPW
ncbi:MAG TPA: hypothetical protein VER08_10280 [Pyrinomonadaceae bacterium]|nr:hypothetical protein [Pyrinomonadaceae bacterium]